MKFSGQIFRLTSLGPTIVWHTCEQAGIIVFCATIKLKVSEFKLARKSVLFL